MRFLVGTAGWSIPRPDAPRFPAHGSALERYASRFRVAEINSSFHRAHRLSTWQRWHDSVPDEFRFSVKLPKQISHVSKLEECGEQLDGFIEQATLLRRKLGVILVQLPPKHGFDERVASKFFADLRARSEASIACEPRHPSWFTSEADRMLAELRVARVAADPAISGAAARPGGWSGLSYWRLHGSPVRYRSSYSDRIDCYAEKLKLYAPAEGESWCIFDNTASSAAVADALALMRALEP
jgi:uncharacterized protein YecE (DUF72 family)